MIGRFLGTDVPACGFSIGFERIVDLLDDGRGIRRRRRRARARERRRPGRAGRAQGRRSSPTDLRVRLERRTKNLKALLDRAAEAGYGRFAFVTADTVEASSLDFKPLD